MKSKKRLLALAGLAISMTTVSPVFAATDKPSSVQSIEFVGMDAPQTAEEMAKAYSTASVKVTFHDGSSKLYPLSYNTLFKSTDKVGGVTAGVAVDVYGKPIMDTSVPGQPTPFVSDDPDANGLIQFKDGKDRNSLYLLTNYEYITRDNSGKSAYGMIPASISLTTLKQDEKTGQLSPVELKKVDFSGVNGLWIPCNGSVTPWNTELTSEEYEPDARAFEANPSNTYVAYFTKNYFQDASKQGNPYMYGFIPEISVTKDGKTTVVKHYSMGRFSHELAKVMPDNKTVYFGDDGSNTMLFMYVADKPKDLSSGTLYAAKWQQTSDQNGGSANLKWIKLGHATDNEIATYINRNIKFSDIFETAEMDTPGFTKIKTYPSGNVEWLKVKPGMEKAAAFLEPRRYGAMLGATYEFNKMEGVTLNAKDKKLYVAMSYVEKDMLKSTAQDGLQDDIQLPKISSGVTYALSLAGGQKDNKQDKIDSQYVATDMSGFVVGEDMAAADDKGNTAAVDKVANPDNLSYSEELRTLFIGEDSGKHTNNFVWAYNVDTKKLSRILSLPAGSEATGLQFNGDVNGFTYILSNLQHPGDFETKIPDPLKQEIEKRINQNFDNKRSGVVGYISGLPSMQDLMQGNKTGKDDNK
ncbi:PhoX family protein [Effusibacillus dendaii]|uniref:Exported alkaline phosphatase n=1 Tax=Effusibacillus dendaii TaxID=2743772 RepID=A0A7I8DBV2_9BACL|nr:alkaline phosphatase PhoX [Effusibacillus dendaii]BCJ87575.1 exported alkaline phosphatase [Effusibacillus dendaii]